MATDSIIMKSGTKILKKKTITSAHLSFAISKCKDLTQENAYRKFAVREIIVAFTTCIGTYFGIGTLQLQDTVYV